jgi:predicted  nucleic acid-binding Zn-ribbon protein
LSKNYEKLLKDLGFLSYTIARIEDKITKLKQEIRDEKNEYKRNRLKSSLWKTRRELNSLLQYLRDSGESESASQQAVNRELKPMRGRASALQKSWQVLSVAFSFSFLESLRDCSPLKRILVSRDWAGAVNKASPSYLG